VLFNREPEPMASIGLEAISVEIMLGDNRPLAVTTPESAPADDPNPNPVDPDTTTVKAEEAPPPEATPVQDPQRLTQTFVSETPPDRPRSQVAETPPDRTDQQQQVAILPEETPAPREPELTAAPEEPVKVTPAEPERPEPVRTETKSQPQPKAVPKQEAKKKQETRPKERSGPEQKTASREPNPTGPRTIATSGGLGPSRPDSNYRGAVSAHLARQKRYPEEARSRGQQGTATVSFTFDGGGRVTGVSLVRGTGSAILDQEVTAMVRRASPFPAPPDGRPQSFTAPVSFRIQ
jgi:periplasmic protein TonB